MVSVSLTSGNVTAMMTAQMAVMRPTVVSGPMKHVSEKVGGGGGG